MEDARNCPACGSPKSMQIYRVPTAPTAAQTPKQRFLLSRIDGRPDHMAAQLCLDCMLVYMSPRLTEAECSRIYRDYLAGRAAFDGDYAGLDYDNLPEAALKVAAQSEELRRDMIASILRQAGRGASIASILDFGGGRGGNIPALNAGCARFVIDYVPRTLPGVTRLARIEDRAPYDLIMCTHVLEHLPSPAKIVELFAGALAPEGLLYVEVPYDIWSTMKSRGGLDEHINFFTVSSLANMMARAGFSEVSLSRRVYPYLRWTTHAICGLYQRTTTRPRRHGLGDVAAELVQMVMARRLQRRSIY
jgi:hypothetical protein